MSNAVAFSPVSEHLQTLAHYHAWATRRLCESVDALSDVDYRRDLKLFFKSVHGSLNHLLVAESLWQPRFLAGESKRMALDHELEPDRHALQERLSNAVQAWQPWIEAGIEPRLQGKLSYTRSDGRPAEVPFAPTLAHVFNHGTHHRGQISAALTMLGQPAPVLDLVYMLQEAPAS